MAIKRLIANTRICEYFKTKVFKCIWVNSAKTSSGREYWLTEVAFGRSRMEAFPDKPKTRVQRFEEKGSDVNLASYLLRDAYRKTVENQLVITGDSDLVTPIQFSVDSGITVHSLIPNPKQRVDALANAASNLRFVETELLNRCQLPGIYYLSKGGSVKKPPSWS